MATLRDIRSRIVGVQKTQKIVSAMKMVAAAKLARAQSAIHSARPYADKLREVLASVADGADADAHPLLAVRDPVRKLDLVLFTSDRGLCGAFNANMMSRKRRRAPGPSLINITSAGENTTAAIRPSASPIRSGSTPSTSFASMNAISSPSPTSKKAWRITPPDSN